MKLLHSLFMAFVFYSTHLIAHANADLMIEPLSAFDNKIIARDLEVMSFILKLGDEVQAMESMPINDSQWSKYIADSTMELLKKSYASTPEERKLIEKLRNLFNWENLLVFIRKQAKNIRSIARLKGLGAAAIIVISGTSDVWFPIIATAMGQAWMVPIFPFVPDTPMLLASDTLIRNYRSKQRIIEAIGGKEAYKSFLTARKEILKELKVSANSYLHPIGMIEGELQTILVTKSGILPKVYGQLGLKEEGFSYSKMIQFLTENNLIQDPEIKGIIAQDLPKEIKAGMLAGHMRFRPTDEVSDLFLERFGSQFRGIKLTQQKAALMEAYKLLVNVKSVAELTIALDQVSPEVSSKQLAQIWKEKILPEWSRNLEGLDIFEFKRLVKVSDRIYGELVSESSSPYYDHSIKEIILRNVEQIDPIKAVCLDALRSI